MSKQFIVLLMVFCHIIDDYGLQQGCLAFLKQRSWWKEHAPAKLYRHDYLMALAMHGFSWTFMVMLPIAAYMNFHPSPLFYIMFAVNWADHSTFDHLKANLLKINLITDQLLHIVQILVTAAVLLR